MTEHWNGASWSPVASPNVGTGNSVLTQVAAIASNDVWAVGYSDGNRLATLAEHWNGSTWSVVAGQNVGMSGSRLFGVAAVSTKDVWAVGEYYNDAALDYKTLIEHWNGSAWSVVASPNGSRPSPFGARPGYNALSAVTAVSAADVWAVGMYIDANGDEPMIERWNGSTWSLVPGAIPPSSTANQLSAVAAVAAGNVVSVGSYANAINLTLAEQWNGTQWSVVATGNPASTSNDELSAVASVPNSGEYWAVGTGGSQGAIANRRTQGRVRPNAGAPTSRTLIERWNGSSWSIVPSRNPSTSSNGLNGVTAVSADNVWAVGSYSNASLLVNQTLIEHYHPLPTGRPCV